MLLLKILLITIAVVGVVLFLFGAYASGITRGLKLMTIKGIKQSELEKKLLHAYFETNKEIDPFFYSLYIKEEMEKNHAVVKKDIKKIKSKTKKTKKSVKK